jgi:N-acyl-L-homoserine lactone synthetase
LAVVRNGVIVVVLFKVSMATIVVRKGISRIVLDRISEIGDGAIVVFFLEGRDATVEATRGTEKVNS